MLTLANSATAQPDTAAEFAALRSGEFARLDANGHAYLDFTGSALYPERLVRLHGATLRDGVLGNPHADSHASSASTRAIAKARARVLSFLGADYEQYAVIFTSNATAALSHVAAGFAFSPEAPLVLTADNHNSVNGIREYAARAGAPVHYLPLDPELRLDSPESRLREISARARGTGLFAYPAQSNFSGVKHPLSLITAAQSLGFRVALDAAALLPTERLSLHDVPADFVALSFYKMFGYPTGIGALVARRDALVELRRPWFAGGTVDYVSVQNGVHALRGGEEGFEDGTPDFLGISAITAGLDFLDDVGLPRIQAHATGLAMRLIGRLAALTHANGSPLVRIYGPRDDKDRGATVAFNVLDAEGAVIPYQAVERRTRSARVSVRGGCFCNPGAAESAFGFPADETKRCLEAASRGGWSIPAFSECMQGRAVGAIRASFGLPSNEADVLRLVSVVESFLDQAGRS